jgi:hypothetical protein
MRLIIMEVMIKIIALGAIGYLFVKAEPLIILKRLIGFKEENYDEYGMVKQFLFRMITCSMCSGFWISLIISGNVFIAAIASIVAKIIDDKL